MRPVSELDEVESHPALDATRAGISVATPRSGDRVFEPDLAAAENGRQVSAPPGQGLITSGRVYDEIRRRLALLGYRWD